MRRWIWVLVAALAAGCATQKAEERRPSLPVAVEVPPLRGAPAAAAQGATQPLPELTINQLEEEQRKPVPRYSFTLREVDIREALLALSEAAGINFIIDPEVQGKITTVIKDATLEEALVALLAPLRLAFTKENRFIRIGRPGMETRVFTLNYVTTTRRGTGAIQLSRGVARVTERPQVGGEAAAAAAPTAGATESIESANIVDIWSDIKAGLTAIVFGTAVDKPDPGKASAVVATSLTDATGRRLIINPVAGAIVVTDLPEKLNRVAEFLEAIEGSAQRQVLIQAKVVEVTLSDAFRFGIDWSALGKLSLLKLQGVLDGGFALSQTMTGSFRTPPSSATGAFQVGLAGGDLTILLTALSQQGEVSVLSSPRISTLNNQRAIIRIGTEQVFFRPTFTTAEDIDPVTGRRTRRAVLQDVEPRTVTVGITLDVTPQIAKDGMITMNIRPTITDLIDIARFSLQLDPALPTQELAQAPVLDVRETDTMVRVRDGETIVIGGLIQNKKNLDERKVPGLGDIPGVGRLFRRTERTSERKELVIFLTPTLVVGHRPEEVSPKVLEQLGLRGGIPEIKPRR